MLCDVDEIVMKFVQHLVLLRGRQTPRTHARHGHVGCIRRQHDRQIAVRRLHFDMHTIRKCNSYIEWGWRTLGLTFRNVRMQRLHRLQLRETAHGRSNFLC